MNNITFFRSVRAATMAAGLFLAGGCGSFDVTDPNHPTVDDLINHPTRGKLSAAATGIFGGARQDITSFIWRLGSMGREGMNIAGNNQPDYLEPFIGPVQAGGSFGGTLWTTQYAQILNVNTYLTALSRTPTSELSPAEKAVSIGFGKTFKALAFLYVVQTRANLGAPVDVDRPASAAPAPFVSEDSVYGYITGLLDEGRDSLLSGGGAFPFPMAPGLGSFATPAQFVQFNRALAAKAWILRSTDGTSCGATCYNAALAALSQSFLTANAADFQVGAFFDYSTAPGGSLNELSDPLTGTTFFSLPENVTDAQTQPGGARDQRVLDKLDSLTTAYTLSGFPLQGIYKFTVYFTGGSDDPTHPIPIIRDEELVLLDAEANIGLGNFATAITDLDLVRTNAGLLAPTTLTPASPASAFIDELLYNRRYSLLWEQGTRWTDARRYGRLASIPAEVPGGQVPTRMPIPSVECSSRGFASGNCDPLGT